ncbi:hypothetical protein A2W14_04540 [Candidatus Gottesmanbacteria bacterium RBG_16_37_8]|uniref:Uncharacterized protein n=1 Tax=Candidatus Gottesmanbacteria bacterium RBG_16_37_8 TaxID=1798371 RepID=A0A1F5YSC4_9BACT|nr:MAG: hypothetical protein A2W14_04540 [Candidatus Gottesmanbacteria bacterium RBG_16_37_8]
MGDLTNEFELHSVEDNPEVVRNYARTSLEEIRRLFDTQSGVQRDIEIPDDETGELVSKRTVKTLRLGDIPDISLTEVTGEDKVVKSATFMYYLPERSSFIQILWDFREESERPISALDRGIKNNQNIEIMHIKLREIRPLIKIGKGLLK